MAMSKDNAVKLKDLKGEIEKEARENYPEEILDEVNRAIQLEVVEVSALAEDLEAELERRKEAYRVRALILQTFDIMRRDAEHPYARLMKQKEKLEQEITAPVRTVGGVKIGKPPIGSGVHDKLDELEKFIKRIKNVAAETIAARYDFTADEVFELVRKEQELYAKPE